MVYGWGGNTTSSVLFQTQDIQGGEDLVNSGSVIHAEVKLSWKNFIPKVFSQTLVTKINFLKLEDWPQMLSLSKNFEVDKIQKKTIIYLQKCLLEFLMKLEGYS